MCIALKAQYLLCKHVTNKKLTVITCFVHLCKSYLNISFLQLNHFSLIKFSGFKRKYNYFEL